MEYDLVIRNGRVIDGTGAPGVPADVAVVGDRIVAVGEVDGSGTEEIDADGLAVTPGFVDAHTHMDAQVFWDDLGTSSCWHGVTTVVMGNCGFTLAPARPEERALVLRNLERAEDIPAEALAAGLPWTWSTFAEYLDAVDALPKGINYAGSIGHSALRTWAMGERAFDGPATDDDLRVMHQELRAALRAGAVGFSTSESANHATSDGRPVASRLASWEETAGLVGLVGRESTGAFELAQASLRDLDEIDAYYRRLGDLAVTTGVPIVFNMAASPISTIAMRAIDDAVARGGQMFALTQCRSVHILQSFRTRLSFDLIPEWQEIRRRPLEAQRAALHDADVRQRLVDAARHGDYSGAVGAEPGWPDYERTTIVHSPYLPNPTVADEARHRGIDPVDVIIDEALASDFEVLFAQEMASPQDDDAMLALLRHPRTAMTLSDAGAHVSQICDASIQSYLLAYWVRERQALSLEEAVHMITDKPARVFGLRDRGLLAPGYAADITMFDPDIVGPRLPRVVDDLPGGATRLVQQADGYAATIVNGRVFTRGDAASDVRSGRLLRAGATTPP